MTGCSVYDKPDFAARADVSRETLEDFQRWKELLERWNARINLVAPSSLEDFWHRHALDSWQLTAHLPNKSLSVLDLGSGAGFPGLALAIALKNDADTRAARQVTLVEATGKKVNFLRTVIRELDLPASAVQSRAEDFVPKDYDIISARAFAPMDKLLTYAQRFWGPNTSGLFLKGQNVMTELTQSQKSWTYNYQLLPSQSDPAGYIVKITNLKSRD